LITVIIPVFNRPRRVLLALDSVVKQRDLGSTKVEIIVVDDHSDPPLNLEYLANLDSQMEIKLIRLGKNSGAAAARNAGIKAASGELIALLDSDDVWLPEKLAFQLAILNQVSSEQPERLHAVACGFYYQHNVGKQIHGRVPMPATKLIEFAGGCWFSPGSTLLLSKDCFMRVGLFDERLRALEDLDWFIRFGRIGGNLHVLPQLEVIVLRRREPRHLASVEHACRLMAAKFGPRSSSPLGATDWRTLSAYMSLECFLVRLRNGKLLGALAAALSSFVVRFRLRFRLFNYWSEYTDVPPQITRTYEVMLGIEK
jgi:glycosyltransferase involved in cell wall biosynthesis